MVFMDYLPWSYATARARRVTTQVSRLAFTTASTRDSIWGAKPPAEGIALARGDVKLALEAMAVEVVDKRTRKYPMWASSRG